MRPSFGLWPALASLFAVMVCGVTPAVGSLPVKPGAASAPGTLTWTACSDPVLVSAGATCSDLTVPLDYSHPHGATIQLALSRVLHTSPAQDYQGVALVNPGGPGGSGLEYSALGAALPDNAGADYDWIGFDPRGVGASIPSLSCDPNWLSPDRPNYVPTSDAVLRTWLARSRSYAAACDKAQPELLRHITTVDSARDMDSIRAALGAKQINYYGYSYGTYLGSVYNTLFPGRMRRAVFDSNIDPRYVWYPIQLHQDRAEQNSMRLFWSWIAQHDAIYGLGSTELQVEARYYDLRAHLLHHPAAGIVGPDELDDAFDEAVYDPQYFWPYLAEDWANYVHHGDTYYLVGDYRQADGYQQPNTPGADNLFAVYNAVQCTDAPWPSLRQQLADAYRTQPAASFYTWVNFWFNAPCLSWPVPARTPVIVHGGTLAPLILDDYADGPTPYSGDLDVRRLYPHGRLIGLPGSNHGVGVFWGNTCVNNAVAAYFTTGVLPARKSGNTADATCPAMATPIPVTYPGTPPSSTTRASTTARTWISTATGLTRARQR